MNELTYRDDAVAFLDIDGVTIHDLQTRRHFEDPIEFISVMDPACVKRLIELQQKYRFKFVMSSSMRKNFKTIDQFQEKYANVGADQLVFHIDWRTPSHPKVHLGSERALKKWTSAMSKPETVESTIHFRGHEIKEWLEAHPEVIAYVAVDDSPDFYPLEEEQCCRIPYGLANGGIAHTRQDLVDKAFEHNFGQKESVLEDMQRVLHGGQILDRLMDGFNPDSEWLDEYFKFQSAVAILMRGYLNITPDEMETLKTIVRENPAFLMVVAGHFKYNINFSPIPETE